jgi:hypothetical protein
VTGDQVCQMVYFQTKKSKIAHQGSKSKQKSKRG